MRVIHDSRTASGPPVRTGYGRRVGQEGTVQDNVPVVQSVDRAIAAIEILARDGWCGVTELATELDIHKSTVFRLLATLERRGIVEQHAQTQKYRLGFGLVRLAASVRTSLDLLGASRSACDRLALQTGETVNLAVLEGRELTNIHQVNLSSSRVSVDWLGSHTDLHCSSGGKVFLAHPPAEVIDEMLGEELPQHTPATITDRDVLAAELVAVRVDGYATTNEELERGLNAIGAPIFGPDGTVVATLSVSGPSYRLLPERMVEMAGATVAAANEISHRLGFLGAASPTDPVGVID